MDFLGDYILALKGCCPLKFLHALKIHQALLAHTPRWDGLPPKNLNRENLKFGLKFSVLQSTRWAGQSPTWGRPAPQFQVQIQFK